jgi:division protein CdvB (Snf7/Vps24/ESCRT-III family)
MSDLQQNIKRINDKLQKLLRNHQQLQKDNERQTKLIKELQDIKERNTQQLIVLQQQVDILKASAGQMTEADKKNFEKHISQYIREIDKCIGILSE